MHAAITALAQSLALPFSTHRARFVDQWHRVSRERSRLEAAGQDQGLMYSISRNLLLAHEDKTFAGALVASVSIPWGDAKGDEDLGGYHLVWTRDLVQSATALLATGDTQTPLRALVYLACSQEPDGGFAQNFWIDGSPYWSAVQLDEVAFPIVLAWRLWKTDALETFDPYPMVTSAARFLVDHGPASEQERWEECAGYSPSTLAISIAALVCAGDFAASRGDAPLAAFLLDYADFLESHVERWTVTTRGTIVPAVARHYIRVAPIERYAASPAEDPNEGTLILNNQPPGAPWQFQANTIVDAGFLELVRYGVRSPGDPLVEDSLRVVDAVLKVETPFGPCWHRYNHDGYGARADGGPYEGWGQGRAWPLLVGERAHYELACGRPVAHLVRAMERFASAGGMLPEQVWDEADLPSAGMYLGRPAGSAMPLMWAHAEYVKLLRSLTDAVVFDLVEPVASRYRAGKGRKDLEVWKPNRQVRTVARGQVLRVQAPAPFDVEWSRDGGATWQHAAATPTSIDIGFADMTVPADQRLPIRFRLAGREYELRIDIAPTFA
jgi:glucoamylase